ncbi:3',5'-cyclic-nucleotide phosphodiesterase pde1 [Ceratobasidium sp. 414]|nr:3',5'-cyclic-nucleotide phosphodiesterase pde1 [Ceratobasidium sp. 414]
MLVRKKRRTSAQSSQFDLVVVGCGGGHDETNLSGYLCKPRDQPWDAGILGLEAGSGYGALKRLLSTTHPHLFSPLFPKSKSKPGLSATDRAYTIYTHLRAFLLTHAHLDHAASLVISAGSLPGPTKYILGAQGVLDDLNRCIFGPGRCWPNIVGWDGNTNGGRLKALPVAPGNDGATADRDEEYTDLGIGMDSIRVRVVPVTHGGSCTGQSQPQPNHINGHHNDHDDAGIYRSSAFFVRHAPTRHEFLFFGDVEADPDPAPPLTPLSSHHSPTPALTPASTLDTIPASTADNLPTSTLDSLPTCNRPLLRPIWEHTAHLFTSSRLHTLLLECSWPAGRPAAQLFGHLGVEQVRKEMRALAAEVVEARRIADTRQTVEINRKREIIEAPPIPAVKPVSTRSQTRTRRAHTESPPPVTRNLKRKATHPVPAHLTFPSPLTATDTLSGTLTGLRVVIIHCKEPAPGFDLAGAPSIADYIVRQLKDGVPETGLGPNELGVEYVAAHQGDEFDGAGVCAATIKKTDTIKNGTHEADCWTLLPPTFLVL